MRCRRLSLSCTLCPKVGIFYEMTLHRRRILVACLACIRLHQMHQDIETALRTEASALTQIHVTVTKQLARLVVSEH